MPADFKPAKRIKDPEALRRFRLENLGMPCEICEMRTGVDPHHIRFRSQGGDDVDSNLLWVCRFCHDNIHNPRTSPALSKPAQPVCAVCGKPAAAYERNRDGTYLHAACSASVAYRPPSTRA